MVKVRFAPSPTGNLHVGNGRTAVLNYLFARSHSGSFLLRIEDTDVERSEAAFEDSIKKDLSWLLLDWDDAPVRQSDRFDIYRTQAQLLLAKGLAYRCFCTKEELETARAQALRHGLPPRYAGTCRALSGEAADALERKGKPYVLRFRSLEKRIVFNDLVHGEMTFPADHVDDFIIMRSDNVPSYNLAAAVDDLLMSITHVIRGADHLSNTPKQIMLFQAFDKEPPAYAHHSLLVGSDKRPLSKRHGATRIAEFRAMGVLPEAMTNYLSIVGRKVDREFSDRKGLIEDFSLSSLSPSDSLFDTDKLFWLNKEHLRAMDIDVLLARCGLPPETRDKVAVLRENARTLNDIRPMLAVFETADIDENAMDYLLSFRDSNILLTLLHEINLRIGVPFEGLFGRLEELSGFSRRELLMLLRALITGRKSGPPLSELYRMIPKEIILKRIKCVEKRLSSPSGT
jgi:nondiscriminating glutamyl-tRNA synthetase